MYKIFSRNVFEQPETLDHATYDTRSVLCFILFHLSPAVRAFRVQDWFSRRHDYWFHEISWVLTLKSGLSDRPKRRKMYTSRVEADCPSFAPNYAYSVHRPPRIPMLQSCSWFGCVYLNVYITSGRSLLLIRRDSDKIPPDKSTMLFLILTNVQCRVDPSFAPSDGRIISLINCLHSSTWPLVRRGFYAIVSC